MTLSTRIPIEKHSGERRYSKRRHGPLYGPNHQPLTPPEAARWRKAEADPVRRRQREAIHVGRMVPGLRLCESCFGFVDDPRHSRIEIGGVGFRSRER